MTDTTRQITLSTTSPALRVSVLRGDAPPTITGGYGGWDTVARPRRQSLTVWNGRDPFTMTFDLIFDAYIAGTSVETPVSILERMALPPRAGAEPPIVRVAGALPHKDLTWVIATDGLAWGDSLWSPRGFRTRQAVTVKLLRYVAPDRIQDGTAASRARDKAAGTGRNPHAASVTVASGDTAVSIAARELGDYTRWPEIADANSIRDPDRLTIGQVLRLP